MISQYVVIIYLPSGTPGVGKSTLCKHLSEFTGLQWLEISKIANDYNCLEEYDEEYKCPILDEDKVLDICSFILLLFFFTYL